MRKIIAEVAISLDGFIEGPQGELDWVIFEEELTFANRFIAQFDTVFYGRNAYEKVGMPRPTHCILPPSIRAFNITYNTLRKYVFSKTEKHVRGNGMVIGKNLESEVKRIRDEDGKDIWFSGGSNMLRTFIALDLIDEFMLAVQPIALGSGKPFFQGLHERLRLQLLQTEVLKSGVVILRYIPSNRKVLLYDRSIQNKCE